MLVGRSSLLAARLLLAETGFAPGLAFVLSLFPSLLARP